MIELLFTLKNLLYIIKHMKTFTTTFTIPQEYINNVHEMLVSEGSIQSTGDQVLDVTNFVKSQIDYLMTNISKRTVVYLEKKLSTPVPSIQANIVVTDEIIEPVTPPVEQPVNETPGANV